MEGHIKKPTQCERMLKVFKDAQGGWVDGMFFLSDMRITQYHARIFELQEEGYEIKGQPIPGKNWKEYRLLSNPQPLKLFQHGQIQHSGT